MDLILVRTMFLLAVAILVAIAARRLALPYTVGLVIAGICMALARMDSGIALTHELIFDVILPPLLFEAALAIHWKELREDAYPVLVLATVGVVISAVIVAYGVVAVTGWPLASAVVFGVLIAATDPVAVIAMFKDTGVKGRLRLLVESESLLNDGVAAVLFAVALSWAQASGHDGIGMIQILRSLALSTGGGIAVGVLAGGAGVLIAGRTIDRLVEASVTAVVAYGSFLVAEHFGVSGVLATVAAGLLMGNVGVMHDAEENPKMFQSRQFVIDFWEFGAFIANSLIFLLIGFAVGKIPFAQFVGLPALAIIIILVLIGRAATVYPLCLLFKGSRWRISFAEQHVLWWGGLRGALGLALSLSLPPSLPFRNEIATATFAVVAFSVVLQGVTMPLLLRKLRFIPKIPQEVRLNTEQI